MITFACPKCDEELEVKDSLAGRTTVCPACERNIRVPTPEEDDEEPERRPRPRKRKPKRRRPSRSWQLPSARNMIFGVLFCFLGSIMLCGGLLSGEVGPTLGGLGIGGGLLVSGVFYFMRSD